MGSCSCSIRTDIPLVRRFNVTATNCTNCTNYGLSNSCRFVLFVADLNKIKLICLIFGVRKFRKQDNRNVLRIRIIPILHNTNSPLKICLSDPEYQNEVRRNFGRISESFQCPKLSVRDSFAPEFRDKHCINSMANWYNSYKSELPECNSASAFFSQMRMRAAYPCHSHQTCSLFTPAF